MDDIVRELGQLNLNSLRPLQADDYDHFILAGASLGVAQPTYTEWAKTFWDHLETAKLQLHKTIHTVLLIEHEDCGAYKLFFRPNDLTSPLSNENLLHQGMALLVEHAIKNHSDPYIKALNVHRLIMRRPVAPLTQWTLADLPPL
ncbi:MAG: hypothetical protein Q8Q09_08675 [Deltaproteobacteria bacterium]|nr:hypothetical protein [Deltaproteobacteria bacterium]